MRRYWLILGLFIAGCMASNGLQYEAMSETNQYHLARIRKGMSQRQVLCIMHKPFSYETFQVDDDIYDVWFYVTRPTGLDQTRMVPQNLTPLTFKNGVLVGTGYNYYYYAMKEQAGEMAQQMPKVEKPKTPAAEDEEFEKTLKAIPQQKTPQQQTAPAAPKTAPEDEKLPPNVHIISKNEIEHVPDEKEERASCIEEPCAPCKSPCGPCTQKTCGPDRFSFLSSGMTESQVFNIFGEPMKHETFEICYDTYDVWFYDTIPSMTAKPSIIPQHQTILTFKNAVLISMDDEKFFELKKIAEAEKLHLADEPKLPPRKPKEWPSIFKQYEHGSPLGVTTRQEISKIKKGMTESEVMKMLGVTADQDTFMIDGDVYNIWFYDVASKQKTAPETIPLTFKNGQLVGTTVKEYNEVRAKVVGPCKDCYDEKGERMSQDESEQNFNYW